MHVQDYGESWFSIGLHQNGQPTISRRLSLCQVEWRTIALFSNTERDLPRMPLAPYLFLIVAEVLNAMVSQEMREGRVQGISLPFNKLLHNMLMITPLSCSEMRKRSGAWFTY